AHARELVEQAERTDGSVIFDNDVTGELGAIDEDHVVADHAVVADVRVGHDEVVAADARDAAALYGAAVHRTELAEVIRVAHFELHTLAGVGEILGIASYDGEGMNMIVTTELRRAFDDGVRI